MFSTLSFSKKSLFFFSLLLSVGFFGWGEKSWGANCGADNKGTCLSKCQSGSGYISYSDPENKCKVTQPTITVCCIEECQTDGESCTKDGKTGTCINKKCVTSSGTTGDTCGTKGGICTEITGSLACSLGVDTGGRSCDGNNGDLENPVALACCIEGKTGKATTTCGTMNGSCLTKCGTGQKEDTAGNTICSPGKCCYYDSNIDIDEVSFGYENPLSSNSFSAWAGQLLTSIQGIVGWLAVIMIMVGGIVYLTSAGTNQATLGKEIITAALIGFAVAVAGPSLLKEIKDLASSSGSTASDAIDSAKDIKSIITSVLNFLLLAMGTLALIGLATGGIFYLTAFGDKGKAETGKKIAVNALYAVALSGGGLILVNQILSLLGS